MRKVFLIVSVLGVGGALLAWLLLRKEHYNLPQIVVRPTLDSIINVHGSPELGLQVYGRTFRRVRGAPPYYISVTNTPFLLFAYERSEGSRMLVLVNTNHLSLQEIPLGASVFGDQIGYWSPTKGQMGDIVESISSNRLVLLSKGFRYLERSVLDLSSNVVIVIETQSDFTPTNFANWTNQ